MTENRLEAPEKAILVSVDCGEYDPEEAMRELSALVEAAGGESVAEVIQKRKSPDPRTWIGPGRLEEIRTLGEDLQADLLVADTELTASKVRAIEKATDLRVVDRTTLILDIFARRARTSEGKLQVELAQLKYRLPRLTGSSRELSRLGGGIGTRGPGESQLETDRRYIRGRINMLEKKLDELEKRRTLTRANRKKGGIPVVSLVGYTNVGKSSILNALTGADAYSENMLFATLDPTVRKLSVGELQQVVLVDTVGFVDRLPTSLVEAFKSTLEEISESDLILMVADASDPRSPEHLAVTRHTIEELGCGSIPSITVYNKCDLPHPDVLPGLHVSARTGEGFRELLDTISERLSEWVLRAKFLFPYDKVGEAGILRTYGNVIEEEYTPEGLSLRATVDRRIYGRVSRYAVEEG